MGNNVILFVNTSELRKGILVGYDISGYTNNDGKKQLFGDSHQWFLRSLVRLLALFEYSPTEKNLASLLGLYFDESENDTKRVYEDFDNLKEAFSKAGFPAIGKNLYLSSLQNKFRKTNVAFSLKPGSILSEKEYWQGNVWVQYAHSNSQDVGTYVLLD